MAKKYEKFIIKLSQNNKNTQINFKYFCYKKAREKSASESSVSPSPFAPKSSTL